MPASRKRSPLNRVLGRLDNLDAVNLTNLVQRLARERGLLEAVFNTIREGVLVVDAAGSVHYSNDAARRLTGLKPEDMAGMSWWKFIPGLSMPVDLAGIGSGGSIVTREVELTYPEPRIVRLYLVPLGDDATTPEHDPLWAVILSDITKDRLSTTELIESERLSSIFLLAAGVAHEIGNPLNSLTIHLQLMQRNLAKQRRTKSTEKLEEGLRICREEVGRLDGIIRNFLEAIRPKPVEFRDVQPLVLLEESLRFLATELQNRSIEVEIEAESPLPVIAGDADQLKQVFFNLIKNAMEAMEPGGRLKIKARCDDQSLHLHFADSGSGIKAEDLGRLFQPFQTTKSSGNGLGLMIVERILRSHGGQVGIDSQPGVGTIVTLSFPLKHRRVRLLGNG